MSLRAVGCWVVATVLGAGVAAAQTLPTSPTGWAVFGLDAVTIGARSRVSGDVGVNQGSATLKRTRVRGAVVAADVGVRRATADTLFCVTVTNSDVPCQTLPSPVVPPGSVTLVTLPDLSGKEDVSVPRHAQHAPLDPGQYGDAVVGPASQLVLTGGDYAFQSIKLASRAKLLCQADCTVSVRDGVTLGQATRLGATGSAAVVLRVQADAKGSGVRIASRAQVSGVVYAPTAAVRVGQAARVSGSLVGQTVTVASRARLTAAGS
jgi:hypothetical protein